MKIGFVGLGKLGKPCAEVFCEKNEVFGYDIKPTSSDLITICDNIKELCNRSEIIFIAVPTPHEKGYDGSLPTSQLVPKDFDYSFTADVLKQINKFVNSSQTVVLISTVLPGTIRRELKPLIPNADLIYNPYLIAMGTVKWDMKNPEMVIIGNETGDNSDPKIQQLVALYNEISDNELRYEMGTWEEAEAIKIFYNTFISAKLSLVNMIQDVAEQLGNMNVDVVTDALMKSDYRIMGPSYMKAGMGDGGPCHPRDNIALRYLAAQQNLGYDLFGAIVDSREVQAENLAKKLVSWKNPVVILGKSYKMNVELTDGSFSVLVGNYVKENNCEVYYDAHPNDGANYTYLLAHMDQFKNYPFSPNSIIVDPWRSFTSDRADLTIIHYGNTRKK